MVVDVLGMETAREIIGMGAECAVDEHFCKSSAADHLAAAAGTGLTLAGVKDWLKGIGGFIGGGATVAKKGFGAAKDVAGFAKTLGVLGLATGTLGGVGYHILKEQMQRKDPHEDMNRKIEAIYAGKKKELSDANWMSDSRARRDALKRNAKRMDPDTYERYYNELVSRLIQKA